MKRPMDRWTYSQRTVPKGSYRGTGMGRRCKLPATNLRLIAIWGHAPIYVTQFDWGISIIILGRYFSCGKVIFKLTFNFDCLI